jgi:hypothetical protein
LFLLRAAPAKFEKCVEEWNENEEISFTVQLGDIIDGNETEELTEQDMQTALAVIRKSRHPMYHVIGNHCNKYNGGRPQVMRQLHMEKAWYRFEPQGADIARSGHVFLVLDGTDISLNRWDLEDAGSKEAQKWLDEHPIEKFSNAVAWNGSIGKEQFSWLERELEEAQRSGKQVFIFCHYPILADHLVMAISLLWNAPEVVALLDRFKGTVLAWFSGHYHQGGAQMPSLERTWAHITLEAVLMAPEQSYAVVDVFERGAKLHGFGSCSSYAWSFPPAS